MTFLDKLTPDQRNTIVSLPYRVGLWVGQSDVTGGSEAERQEQSALASIIHGFAEEMFGSETMQYIISDTLAKKDKWPQWAGEVASVPQDCQFAIDLMSDYTDAKDIKVFRTHLLEIGEAVALAFREQSAGFSAATLKLYFEYLFLQKKAGRRRTFGEFLRISTAERKALSKLAQSLGGTY